MAQDQPVTLAVIIGAHGVTGEVRLKLFGEGAAALKRYRAFNDSALTLEKLRDDNKGGACSPNSHHHPHRGSVGSGKKHTVLVDELGVGRFIGEMG